MKSLIPDFSHTIVEELSRVHAHSIPLSFAAIVLTSLIAAMITFYVCGDWNLVAVTPLLLMIFALLLRTIRLIDSFRRSRQKSKNTLTINACSSLNMAFFVLTKRIFGTEGTNHNCAKCQD